MATNDGYPGRQIRDEDRTMYGLGWEHKRRGLKPEVRLMGWPEYMQGWGDFHCSDDKTNRAMLKKGVSISDSGGP